LDLFWQRIEATFLPIAMMALLRLKSKRSEGRRKQGLLPAASCRWVDPSWSWRDCEPASRQVKLGPQTEAEAHRQSTNFGARKLAEASNRFARANRGHPASQFAAAAGAGRLEGQADVQADKGEQDA
jgi:hypothetical protein